VQGLSIFQLGYPEKFLGVSTDCSLRGGDPSAARRFVTKELAGSSKPSPNE